MWQVTLRELAELSTCGRREDFLPMRSVCVLGEAPSSWWKLQSPLPGRTVLTFPQSISLGCGGDGDHIFTSITNPLQAHCHLLPDSFLHQ